MSEYIDRAAVHELVKRIPKYEMFNYDRTEALLGINPDDVDFGVDKIPAAEVAEVRHGRWIPEACESVSKRNRLIEYRVYSCSICGRSNGRVKKRYCPNCGAYMNKEDEHEAD